MKHALIALFLLGGIGLLAFRLPLTSKPPAKLYPALAEYLKSGHNQTKRVNFRLVPNILKLQTQFTIL